MEQDEKLPDHTLGFYWHFLKRKKGTCVLLIFLIFLFSLRESLGPFLVGAIVDGVIRASETDYAPYLFGLPDYIFWPLAWVLIIQFFNEWLQAGVEFIYKWLRPWLKGEIRATLFSYVQHHAPQYFQDHFAGQIGGRITMMAPITDNLFDVMQYRIILPILHIITVFSILVFLDWTYAAIVAIWMVAYFSISFSLAPHVKNRSRDLAEAQTKFSGESVDVIGNAVSMKHFARLNYEDQKLRGVLKNEAQMEKRFWNKYLVLSIFQKNATTVLIFFMTFALLMGWQEGNVLAGEFAAILYAALNIGYKAYDLGYGYLQWITESGKVNEALSLITQPHELTDKEDASKMKVKDGRVEIKEVGFQHANNPVLFDKLSIDIPARQKIGLVGVSGAGKSTLVNLLLRFFDVNDGQILIDGQNIADVTQNSLRENMAVIPQDTALFHRSLMENIRYGRLDASDDEVVEAARRAHAHEFISNLPEGYDTLVGERGVKLSGGQRQRIAIARAILKDAPILILDEATSALDSESEKLIQDSLADLMEGKTVIAIAHRLSTISHLDRLIVMEKGQIIEDGTHTELLKQQGLYAKLGNMQSGGFIKE